MQTTPTTTTTAECDEVNPPPTPSVPPSLPPPSVAVQLPTLRCSARASRKGTYSRMGSAESAEPTSSKQCHRRQRPPRSVLAPPTPPPSSRCCCSWRRFWRGCFCGRFSTLLLLPALLVSNENEFFFSFSLSLLLLLLLLHFFAHPTRFVFFG